MNIDDRNLVIDECCAALCGGCRQGIPIEFDRHQTLPANVSGGSYPCVAFVLQKLKTKEADNVLQA